MARNKVFISYSHKDVRWLERVKEQLEVLDREDIIELFADTYIGVGENWYDRLDREMLDASVAVLLISASFLTSSFIRKDEVPKLFKRHEEDGMVIYPLLIRDCAWQRVAWLAAVQIRPNDARPVGRHKDKEKCLADVAREIASIVEERAIPSSSTSVLAPAPRLRITISDLHRAWQGVRAPDPKDLDRNNMAHRALNALRMTARFWKDGDAQEKGLIHEECWGPYRQWFLPLESSSITLADGKSASDHLYGLVRDVYEEMNAYGQR